MFARNAGIPAFASKAMRFEVITVQQNSLTLVMWLAYM
jgi:hypothetical protein